MGVTFIAHVPVPSQKEVRQKHTHTQTHILSLKLVLTTLSLPAPLPSSLCLAVSQVEEALVRRKKMELLERYASETLQAQSQTARTLLGL